MPSASSCMRHLRALNIYENIDRLRPAAIHLKSQSRLTISIISPKSMPVNNR